MALVLIHITVSQFIISGWKDKEYVPLPPAKIQGCHILPHVKFIGMITLK